MTYIRIEIDNRFGITFLILLLLFGTGLCAYKFGYKKGVNSGIEKTLEALRASGPPLDNHRY